jgi:hypothetical protein
LPHKDEILKEFREALEVYFAALYRRTERIKSCKIDLEYEGEII